jgi:hypothetical protein
MVIDTSTNTGVSKVKHPDFIQGAWGRFHPTKKRYYAGASVHLRFGTRGTIGPLQLSILVSLSLPGCISGEDHT